MYFESSGPDGAFGEMISTLPDVPVRFAPTRAVNRRIGVHEASKYPKFDLFVYVETACTKPVTPVQLTEFGPVTTALLVKQIRICEYTSL